MNGSTESNPSTPQERRRHRRYRIKDGDLEVSWIDSTGNMKTARAPAINVSENGIALQLPEPVLPLRIQFQSLRMKVVGIGAVRQCRCVGRKYVVGLEFTEGLHWRAPEGDVREPISLCDSEV
jgi:hypothetical protein